MSQTQTRLFIIWFLCWVHQCLFGGEQKHNFSCNGISLKVGPAPSTCFMGRVCYGKCVKMFMRLYVVQCIEI